MDVSSYRETCAVIISVGRCDALLLAECADTDVNCKVIEVLVDIAVRSKYLTEHAGKSDVEKETTTLGAIRK